MLHVNKTVIIILNYQFLFIKLESSFLFQDYLGIFSPKKYDEFYYVRETLLADINTLDK